MLSALERSRLTQRQLDLRRLARAAHAADEHAGQPRRARWARRSRQRNERARVLTAAQAQLQELTVLMGDLVDLSKTEVDELEVEDVRLDVAAATAMRRARLHGVGGHSSTFLLDAAPCLVRAAPARLDRAIANLLDNACKWSPPTSRQAAGRSGRGEGQRWCARGPRPRSGDRRGGPAPRVRPLLPRARRAPTPGSGLGLAIVRQFAKTHSGKVLAQQRCRWRRPPDARAAAA